MSGRCKYWKNCSQYNNHSVVCSVLEGFAYASRWGGCYRDLAKFGKESKYWREKTASRIRDREPVLNPSFQ